jgi:hypothetical protein
MRVNQLRCTLSYLVIGLVAATPVLAQSVKLPEPTRTVYKCEEGAKIVYTDQPCAGAKRVDVEPTRGMNSATGRELVGADVRREQQSEVFAEAVRPLTGKNAAQLETERRRAKLTDAAKSECRALDQSIAANELQESRMTNQSKASVQRELHASRRQHRALGC